LRLPQGTDTCLPDLEAAAASPLDALRERQRRAQKR